MKTIIMAILLVCSVLSAEELEDSAKSRIKSFISYSKFGNGDVFIQLDQNGSTCSNGYFIDANSNGYKTIISMLLTAYTTKESITITAYKQNRWVGSGGPVCEIYDVKFD